MDSSPSGRDPCYHVRMRYNPPEPETLRVDRRWDGARIDVFVTAVLNWRSRTSMQAGIADGQITLNGRAVKPSSRVRAGDRVRIEPRPDLLPPFDADAVTLDVLFEDDWLLAVNKPPHLVVHPTCSHLTDNLVHVLEQRYRGQEGPEGPVRPQLAHRIDGNTSGVLLLTKQESVRATVARQFAGRTVTKSYHAFVHGEPVRDAFEVDAPIGRDPGSANRMRRCVLETGLAALTRIRVLERGAGFARLSCLPHTGRTHQIRVHLAHAGFPILCDGLYGRGAVLRRGDLGLREDAEAVLMDRHALHSRRLVFRHPVDQREIALEAPYTEDLKGTLTAFRETGARGQRAAGGEPKAP